MKSATNQSNIFSFNTLRKNLGKKRLVWLTIGIIIVIVAAIIIPVTLVLTKKSSTTLATAETTANSASTIATEIIKTTATSK
ncbi:hypothetical protein I4U23_011231, partial [Adineta vaga]